MLLYLNIVSDESIKVRCNILYLNMVIDDNFKESTNVCCISHMYFNASVFKHCKWWINTFCILNMVRPNRWQLQRINKRLLHQSHDQLFGYNGRQVFLPWRTLCRGPVRLFLPCCPRAPGLLQWQWTPPCSPAPPSVGDFWPGSTYSSVTYGHPRPTE